MRPTAHHHDPTDNQVIVADMARQIDALSLECRELPAVPRDGDSTRMRRLCATQARLDPDRGQGMAFVSWPKLTATNQDTEGHRLVRLARLFGCAAVLLADYLGDGPPADRLTAARTALLSGVAELADHKGHLTAVWSRQPTIPERTAVEEGWSAVGEDPSEVTHILPHPTVHAAGVPHA